MSNYTPIEITRGSHYGSNYYIVHSNKIGRNVKLHSQLEYMNYLTLEMNPSVINFCEQPLKIKIEINGKYEYSIFDMWVQYKDSGEEFQEVKHIADMQQESKNYDITMKQFNTQQQWCDGNNFNYKIRTEKEIILGPYYINNLRFLLGCIKRQKFEVCRQYTNMLQTALSDKRIKIFELLQKQIIPKEWIYPTIAVAIYDGAIKMNIEDKVISFDSEIWSNDYNT